MRPQEYEEDAENFGEALPVDVFKQVAQTIVAQVRMMIEHRARYEPVNAASFPQCDADYYDRTERDLAQLGFQTVGDFEDASLVVTDASTKSSVRFAVGEALDITKRILEEAGAPVGSQLLFEEGGVSVERPFGVQEGLALYLDGTTLPDEVYQQTDIDALMERLAVAVDSVGGELRSAWNGPTETALYHYGPSADAMLDALQQVFDDFPICQNARLVIRQRTDRDARTMRIPRRDGA
jgi:hypothetical protein